MRSTGPRQLDWEGCFNVRDLGGLPTRDGRRTRFGALVRGDSACRLTDAGCAAALDHGVRTVIDLRSPREIAARGPVFRRLADEVRLDQDGGAHPFAAGGAHAGLVAYLAPSLPDRAESYRSIVEAAPSSFALIARSIADASPGAVLVHCHIGRDRAGVVIGVLLAAVGVIDRAIAADYALSAACLAPLYAHRSAAGLPPEENRSARDTMLTLLRQMTGGYGGAPAYLLEAGLRPEELERLTARLLKPPV